MKEHKGNVGKTLIWSDEGETCSGTIVDENERYYLVKWNDGPPRTHVSKNSLHIFNIG